MALPAERPVGLETYGGFAPVLFDVLGTLGVHTDDVEYVCRGLPGPNGLQGHTVIVLRVPASTTIPGLRAFRDMEVETSVDACVQAVCRTALRHVCRDAYEHLKDGPYRLLPRALDPAKSVRKQVAAADRAASAVEDPCLEVMGHYVLTQDRYISEIETANHSLRALLSQAKESLAEKEQERLQLYEEASKARTDFWCNTSLHTVREKGMEAEIERLKSQLGAYELRNDHLLCQKLELEDAMERLKLSVEKKKRRENRHGYRMMTQMSKNVTLRRKIKELTENAALNLRHLKEYFKVAIYLRDRVSRTEEAWKRSDERRKEEYRELQRAFPPGARKEPYQETFRIEDTQLDLAACPTGDYYSVGRTKELDEAVEYVRRMYPGSDEPQAAESSTAVPRLG